MDKKLKKAADKITMPSDMKERIINACENAERNRSNSDNNDGYIDVVSSAERVDPRSRIIRTISAVAACAVLVSGLGATGVFLHRQHGSHMSGSEVSECRSCPFGDFSTFEYTFDAEDGMYGNYSIETYAKLSDFLNKFNWGSELEEYETRTPDQDIEGQIYNIKWTKGDTPPIECNINIFDGGFVTYQESMMDFETGAQKTITENSRCYKIDFDAFDSGIMEILSKADEAPTPFGDFTTFDYTLNANDGKYNDLSDDKRAKLSDFLNKFAWGEEISADELTEEEKSESEVKLHYLEWRIENKVYGLVVNDLGLAVYNVSKVNKVAGNREELKQESVKLYRVDYEAFDRDFMAILKGETTEKELTLCNDSPFAEILAKAYDVAPFSIYNTEATAEQREKIADIFNSQTWYEFDGAGEYFGWIITPNRNDFTVTCTEGKSVDVISVGYPNIACIYSRTYDDSGNITDSDWRFFKCDNKNIYSDLAEVFGIKLEFGEDNTNEEWVDQNLGTERNILDVVHDERNDFRLYLSDGNDFTDTDLTAEQKEQLVSFFENYELKDEDLVPDMWKGYGSDEFEEYFGESFIMISNEERVEKDISVSKDRQYIALYSAGSYNEHGFDTRVYRLHDADELIKGVYYMLYGID
ncbi:hypothetical protein [Ruminococcus flavefaciens]|uniref:hypothetical protein n=1 Tax=Ruminococcus flavefaciens TaxID=1265 RepID=UPI00046508D1|nr:hypothetical protein [Ruminococcus flavefaciens]